MSFLSFVGENDDDDADDDGAAVDGATEPGDRMFGFPEVGDERNGEDDATNSTSTYADKKR